MSESLFEDILGSLRAEDVDAFAREAGTDAQQTQAATGAAVSALLRGLANSTSDQQSAADLLAKLKREQAQLESASPEKPPQLDAKTADDFLSQIFGGRKENVEDRLGKATGVGKGNMGKILASLLPVVLGMMMKRGGKENVQTGPDLSKWLGQEHEKMQKKGGKDLGFLDSLLDADKDGDVDIGDITSLAGKFLGGR